MSMSMLFKDSAGRDWHSGPGPSDSEACIALLRRAATLLCQARECRVLAASIGKKKARGALLVLAVELESQAQTLARRAEGVN